MSKKAERQQRILEVVRRKGFASNEDLAAALAVTTQTIRRDLAALAGDGAVRRYHGGAGLAAAIEATPYKTRKVTHVEAKRRIGRKVAALVPDGASVFLDTGTTMESVAEALAVRRGLRVVTNNLRVANFLSEHTDFTIALPGGFVRNSDGGVFGDGAGEFLRRFRVDVAIIGISGIDEDGTLTDDDWNEVALVRIAMAHARSVLLATDATKFGRTAMVCLGPITEISGLVTDAAPEGPLAGVLAESRVALHLA